MLLGRFSHANFPGSRFGFVQQQRTVAHRQSTIHIRRSSFADDRRIVNDDLRCALHVHADGVESGRIVAAMEPGDASAASEDEGLTEVGSSVGGTKLKRAYNLALASLQ